ncbi:MAG TPA: carboxypeptidase regulatory-like domain-containing protein, partial [Thermoanaerobaculia bacterium]|nr:carboxypeptidase regulatory-like domain-containing protein [Thermoanaerobaculia bacterium]
MNLFKRVAVFLGVLLLVSLAASAQNITASLAGHVTSGDGQGLPGATVTIASPALQGSRTTTTDVNGNYNFGALPPGTYTVKVSLEGMKTVTKTVPVTLNASARVDATLVLTAMTEAITVTATAPAVLETNEVQTNVQAALVNSLPMGRTLTATTTLSPGVTTASGSSTAGGGASAGAIQISGAPAYDSAFMVNGVSILENLRGQPHNLFIEDAIQETTVLTGGISAEFGRFTGGVVNAITKSGGNEFSGSVRDSLSNDGWVARGTLNTSPITSKVNSTYEGTLGGRILRDRLWFFAAGRFAKLSLNQTLADANSSPYTFTDKNTRYEGKLTGQITDKHSIVASYLDIKNPQTNNCFIKCLEFSNIELSRELPNNFKTIHYNGILTNSLIIEASWSKKYFAFVGSGGDFSDFAHGSYGADYASGSGYFNAPVICGFCSSEQRNNKLYNAKATYYLASKGMGTHSFVVGYDQWAEQRIANNYQSGSNFAVYIYNDPVRPTCINGVCHPSITPSTAPGNGDGDLIKWAPILTLTKGSNFRTDSIYANDKWDLNSHWNFNIGFRYDKNDGGDSS